MNKYLAIPKKSTQLVRSIPDQALLALLLASLLGACASIEPDITSEMGSPRNELPRLTSALEVDCKIPKGFEEESYFPEKGVEVAGILGIIASAIITKGVDHLGEKIKAAGEKEKRSIEAYINIPTDLEISCFTFSRGQIKIVFAMVPAWSVRNDSKKDTEIVDYSVIEFRVLSVEYGETIDRKSDKVRGLTLSIEAVWPDSEKTRSASISLGNIETGASVHFEFKSTPFVSTYMKNPFMRPPTTVEEKRKSDIGLQKDTPFSLKATLTEVKNVNALAKFAGEVADESNDALTEALLYQLGLDPETDEKDEEGGDEAPPAGNPDG